MNSKFLADFSKPTILTAQHYDRKITVEIDHSDTELDEIMDAFETLLMGMGYHMDSYKKWILERAKEINEEEDEFDDYGKRNNKPTWDWNDLEDTTDWNEENASKRMDVIGQNGNEGLHYDNENPWGSEEEDEEINWPKPNKVLIDAKKQYDEQVKMSAKPVKKRKKKTVEDWENEIDLGGHE